MSVAGIPDVSREPPDILRVFCKLFFVSGECELKEGTEQRRWRRRITYHIQEVLVVTRHASGRLRATAPVSLCQS